MDWTAAMEVSVSSSSLLDRAVSIHQSQGRVCVPLSLVLLKDLALRVVTQSADIDEAAQVELLRAEHRHAGQLEVG